MASIHCDFYSNALGMSTSLSAILPQPTLADLQAASPGKNQKHPTLFLLHGLLDDHTTWRRLTSIERYAEPLGLAVVMPAVQRSFYSDMARGYRYWTFVSEELPALARSFFPLSSAREDNFVAGLSMGGYGAFRLALTHPTRYAAAASLSGALDIVSTAHRDVDGWRTEMENIFGDLDRLAGSDSDLFHLAEQASRSGAAMPKLYQCCGTEDFLYQDNVKFHEHATALKLPLTYEAGPGEHEWGYWDRQIQKVLAWLPLKRPREAPSG
jgi:S-formylglutathione hydrolase FrmB